MLSTREGQRRTRRMASERERGVPVNLGVRFISARAAEAGIIDVLRLPPAVRDETPLQDANGNFYAMDGYSAPGGPDKAR